MAGVAGVASVQVCKYASMQVSRKSIFHHRNNERYICYANAIYLVMRYTLTLFVCDMPSAFYSVIADLKSIIHRKRSPFFSKKVKNALYLYMTKRAKSYTSFCFFRGISTFCIYGEGGYW